MPIKYYTKENPLKVTIDRKTWLRGVGDARSSLLIDDKEVPEHGMMCCLGFVGLACKVPKKYLINTPSPNNSDKYIRGNFYKNNTVWNRIKDFIQSEEIYSLMEVNDDLLISDNNKESQIKDILKKFHVHVKFVGPKKNPLLCGTAQ